MSVEQYQEIQRMSEREAIKEAVAQNLSNDFILNLSAAKKAGRGTSAEEACLLSAINLLWDDVCAYMEAE